ncbi:quinolinate synthetase [Hathewaya proteolytica DSM 3090]|uniref:Quinolinate synthase n=1 Tax=Hathewaya proteolytica DSM 3090 TaxID=1121331 RepID=A0A1M6SI34_9CLOT|nr:quinolinate synthase NadA [Hathewaya proteolytica]SHK44208.1 quinolinate synthetase [Hathewaya proteolytica DSM 3090]
MNLKEEIARLKKERNAIILAHYYVNDEIQEIADFVGDSYYLSKVGMESDKDVIVFCGVRFMAEGAKILSPEKTVLLSNEKALCAMAQMAEVKAVEELKLKYPDAKVVCYVNSTTELKAISDVCCTSASALNIINNMEDKNIIFVPDKNLGSYIQEMVPEKNIILWNGCCPIHDEITVNRIEKALDTFGRDLCVLVHPECTKEVRALADYIGSTSGIIKYASESSKKKFLVVTEDGVLYEMRKKNPNKEFYSLDMCCDSMKLTTLDDVYQCLLNNRGQVTLKEDLRLKAYRALENMHKLGE